METIKDEKLYEILEKLDDIEKEIIDYVKNLKSNPSAEFSWFSHGDTSLKLNYLNQRSRSWSEAMYGIFLEKLTELDNGLKNANI